jgi:hypothetical protein
MTIDNFVAMVELHNDQLNQLPNNLLHIESDIFNNEILDREIYDRMVEFAYLPNHYKEASEIHKIWYNLNRQAEIDVLGVPDKLDKFSWELQSCDSQRDYDIMLKLIRETYQ